LLRRQRPQQPQGPFRFPLSQQLFDVVKHCPSVPSVPLGRPSGFHWSKEELAVTLSKFDIEAVEHIQSSHDKCFFSLCPAYPNFESVRPDMHPQPFQNVGNVGTAKSMGLLHISP